MTQGKTTYYRAKFRSTPAGSVSSVGWNNDSGHTAQEEMFYCLSRQEGCFCVGGDDLAFTYPLTNFFNIEVTIEQETTP